MDILKEFASATEQFKTYRAAVGEILPRIANETVKAQLTPMLAELDQNMAQLQTVMPQAVAQLDAKNARTQAMIDTVKAKVEEQKAILAALKDKLAAQAAAPPEVPVKPPLPPLDAALGGKLKGELLAHYKLAAKPANGDKPETEMWEAKRPATPEKS